MYRCKNTDEIITDEKYFEFIRREFNEMKQNGDFEDNYDEDMTEEEIKEQDESLIEESMCNDDDFKNFEMYEIEDLDDLKIKGLGADAENRKKILGELKIHKRLFLYNYSVWDNNDGFGEIIAYVDIIDADIYEEWKSIYM